MLWNFAVWCEHTPLGLALSTSSWLFPVVEFIHLAGLATIGGAVLIVDMRLLGLGLPRYPVAALAHDVEPYVIGSLLVMVATGIPMFTYEATKLYSSPAFWIKITSLILVTLFTFTVRRRVTAAGESGTSAATRTAVAIVSLTLWSAVGWGGRWIGFGG